MVWCVVKRATGRGRILQLGVRAHACVVLCGWGIDMRSHCVLVWWSGGVAPATGHEMVVHAQDECPIASPTNAARWPLMKRSRHTHTTHTGACGGTRINDPHRNMCRNLTEEMNQELDRNRARPRHARKQAAKSVTNQRTNQQLRDVVPQPPPKLVTEGLHEITVHLQPAAPAQHRHCGHTSLKLCVAACGLTKGVHDACAQPLVACSHGTGKYCWRLLACAQRHGT